MYRHTELNLFVVKKTARLEKITKLINLPKSVCFVKILHFLIIFTPFPWDFSNTSERGKTDSKKCLAIDFLLLSLSTSCTTHEIFKYKSGSALMYTQYLPICAVVVNI